MVRRNFTELEGQLYQDLLYDYKKIPRPIKNSTDVLIVNLGASLIRIIDVVSKLKSESLSIGESLLTNAASIFLIHDSISFSGFSFFMMKRIKFLQQTYGLRW